MGKIIIFTNFSGGRVAAGGGRAVPFSPSQEGVALPGEFAPGVRLPA